MATEETKLPDGLAEAAGASATEPGAEEAAAGGGANRKKRLIVIGAAALLALGGGGGAWFWLAGGEPADEAHAEAEAETPESFVDVPPMTVNLRTADGASRYLKVHLMLVPGKVEGDVITKRLPLVIDSYQPFLRELRPEDLAGSAAAFRIKEELLVRANAMLGAGAVRDVLIQDLVQQ